MRPPLHLAALACVLGATRALGGETIKPTLHFDDMRLLVKYVSTGELVNLQARSGAQPTLRDVRQDHRHGFSILKKNRETGMLTCEIYLPEGKRPREVDDEATLSLGHEVLHCLLGNYHR
jgi:hypothetical protein